MSRKHNALLKRTRNEKQMKMKQFVGSTRRRQRGSHRRLAESQPRRRQHDWLRS